MTERQTYNMNHARQPYNINMNLARLTGIQHEPYVIETDRHTMQTLLDRQTYNINMNPARQTDIQRKP